MTIESKAAQILARKRNALVKASVVFEQKLKANMAVDTGRLEDSIRARPVEETKTEISAKIGTDGTGYARFVEEGTQGKVKNYGRKSPRGNGTRNIIYSGVGLRAFERTTEQERENIINIIRNG